MPTTSTLSRRMTTAAATALMLVPLATARAEASEPSSHEVSTVRAVKSTIAATITALEAGDLAAARSAEQQYNILWHGVEVYLNFRSKPTYDVLEGDIQNRLETELAKQDASAATALNIAKELRTKYDEVIAISENGAPLSGLFDDLQRLRWNRAYLAQGVVADLNSGNAAAARVEWATFASGFPQSIALVRLRSADVAAEADRAFGAAAAAFADSASTVEMLKPLAAAVNTKLGVGVTLLNAAARNSSAAKAKMSAKDLSELKQVADLRTALVKAGALRRAQDPAAVSALTKVTGPLFNSARPALASRNGSDIALATALAGLTKAAAGGDAAAFDTAFTAALNATLVAQQVVAGQFWTDAKVQKLVNGRSS
jgi:hypothetical protein